MIVDVIEDAPARFARACALAWLDEVRLNTIVTPEPDAGITVSFDRLTVSVDAGVDFAAACPPDVVADAVQVKAKKDRNDQCGEYCFLHVRKPPFFHQ